MNKLATLFFSLFLFSAAYSQCPDVTAYTANVEEGLCVFTGKVSISGACEGLRASLIHPSGTELRENIAADGTAEFTNLGVGTYTLTLVDTGTTPPTESAPQTLVITTLAEAFVATPVPGNCTANGAIVISNTCNDLFAVLTFPNGETLTQKIENGGTEFTSLSDGTYKIYLESQVTGEVTAEREISLANLYQNIILQIHSVTAPTCATSNDGVVQYRIISGGVGPFRVSLLDTGGNTVISEERTRNTATEVINGSFQGTNALPLNSGSYQLVIEDLAGNVAGCGATVVNPIVIPQALNTNVLCYEIEKHPDSYFKLDGECKYRLYLRVKPVDTSLRLTVDQNFYSQPGTAVVIVNETLTYDISSSLGVISNNTNVGWAYVTGHVINPGDDVRVIVKGGMNTIDEHFTFTNLAEPKPGFNATPYASVDSNNCGTVQLRFNMNLHNLTSNHPAVDGNGTYSYRHQWYHSPWDNDNKTNGYWFKVEKQNADGTTWTDVSDNVDWTAYNWVNVTATGEGRYRFTYQQAPNQCYQTSLERVITNTFDDNYIQDKILNSYDKLYGAYEGTVGFYKYFVTSGTEFSWPLVSKLERADGQTSVTYQARLPYEEVKTYTINFPMEKTVTGSGQNSAWGDLPPGSYIWTVTDACGRTASTTVNLDTVTHYKEELIVKNECDLVSISFNLNAQTASGVPITAINTTVNSTLHYKNSAGNWVNYSSLSAGYPVIRGSSGTFSNLPPTYEYRVFFNDIRYPRELTSSSVVDGISVIRTTIPNIKPNDIYTRFTNFSAYPTVAPKERIAAAVSASFCDVTNNSSGLVSVAVTNPQVLEYPLYFELWRKKNPADPASTDQLYTPRVSYDENSGATSHVFTGVTNGDYFVRVGHECGYQDYDVHVEVSQYITPSLTSSKTNNICVGDTARLRFTGSETIFDIKWYRIEEDGTATEIGTNVRLMDVTLERTTTYRVVYGVKASLSCASTYTFPPREITLTVRHDTTPPVPNCPSNITVTAERGECSQIVTWTEPTYTDDCPVTVTSTHQSGDRFDIGDTEVTYTFTDSSGNVSTCTFTVTVVGQSIELTPAGTYVDGSGAVLSTLNIGQQFYYRLQYRNTGQEHIREAKLTVILPEGLLVTSDGTADVTGASVGTSIPTYTYSATTKTFEFDIPDQTLLAGTSNQRTILIPLALVGDCDDFGKPCANYLRTDFAFAYTGGNVQCVIPPRTANGTTAITVSTDSCQRSELYCAGDELLITAESGFDTYRWYRNGTLLNGVTGASYTATTEGLYRVEKVTNCDGVQVISTETVNYYGVATLPNPLRDIEDGGATCADDGTWTSHFILCNEPSRVLSVNFRNTTNLQWQRLNADCAIGGFNCPNYADACYTTITNGTDFTADTEGNYRLVVTGDDGCRAVYYFNVYKNGIDGEVSKSDYTEYQAGYINVQMETSGLTYTYILKDANGNIVQGPVTKTNATTPTVIDGWKHTFENLQEGTYTVEVSSPSLPASCIYTEQVIINKTTELEMTANLLAWTGCNEVRIRFTAQGGRVPYKFAVWSIDGVALYPNFVSIPESAFEATIPAGQSSVEGLFKITQPGRYVFVVQDADQKSALLAETQALDIRPEGLYGFTYDITDVKCGSTPNTGAIRLTFAQQQNRTTVLYQVENGNRTQVGTNATGVYTGLYEGNYELEISITIGTEVCTYTQPFTVGGAENTLYAFAGVVQDKSCDTASPQRYQVAINNAGGGVAPYEYSFDGNTYGTSNVGYLGGSATVYVRDSEGCVLPLDVVIAPTEIPQISVSPVAYDCDGYGTFTITATATTPMEYRYQIDNGELLLSNVIGPLAPRATPYNLTVYYTPAAAAGMTPNILFTEDFGTGADTCGNNINYLACKTGEVLSNGDYTITAQLQANTGWVAPTPTDASGVANGRYLAVMGANTTGNAGILYYKDLKDIVSGRDMNVSLNLFNLLSATANGQNPHIVLELANAQGTVIATRDLGILTASQAWESKEVTFTGLTVTEAQFRIRNTSSGNALGNDIAIDDIRIWQDTEYCQTNVPQTVLVEPGKAFNAVLTGSSDISCPNGDDGTLTVHVSNPPASLSVEYSIDNQTTWTATTVNTDGEFTVGGLSVTAGGTLHVRSADDTSCVKSLPYTLSEPDTMSITTEQIKFISCATTDNLASVRVTATGGTRPYAQFRYREEGTTAWSTPQTAVNNETTFTNLNAGTYEVEIEDAGGCTATTTFEVAAKRDVVITTQFTYCYTGNRDAEITVQVQDGNGNYQFSKDGGLSWEDDDAVAIDGLGYHVFGNLTDGTYDIMVRDGLGCSTTTTVVITPQLQLNVIQTQDLDCRGNGASFSLTAIGGQGVKTFAWSIDGATYTSANTASETLTVTGNTAVFVTSAEGTYYFRVQDELRDDGFTRCEDVSNVYEVKAEQPRWVAGSEPTATHILCNGATTGQINVTANAIDTAYGLAPYTVEVYEDDGTGQASGTTDLGMYNLPAGDYVVIITDAKGCTSTPTQVSITQPDALQVALTVKPLQCNGNGSMTLGGVDIYLGDGGTAGFTVVLNNASGQQIATNTMGNTQTVTVSNLNFGRYTVVITDANNCVTTREFTVDAYSDIMITAVPTVSAIGCEPGTGAILVSAYNSSGNALGDGSFFFAVYQPGLVFNESDTTTWFPGATATITYTDSNGVPQQATGATYEFTTLTPGASYVFAVYDKTTECIYIQESTIPVPTTSTMSVTLSAINNETCFGANNGHAVFTLTGLAPNTTSVDYQVYTYPDGQPVGAVENTTSYTDIATPKALAPGEYYIVFTEQNASGNGCVNASERFIIRRSATLLEVTATSPKNDNCHPNAGQIVVQATGGTAPYQYIYRNDDTIPTDADWTATTAISTANVEGGVWTVFVRDAYNCVQSAVVTVTTDPSPVITSVVTENICANNGNYNIEVTMTTLGTGAHSYRLNGGIPVAINWLRSDVFLVSNLLPSAQLGISPQSIEVIDVNGCSHSMTFDIFEPLTYQASVTKELDCSATPSAELTIRNVQGGTGNYTYTVDRIVTTLEPVLDQDGNPVVDQDGNPVLEEVETVIPHVTATAITNPALTTATVMLEGTYRINVYDANTAACPVSVDVLLSAARVPVVTVDTVTNELCDSGTGAGTGSISVSAVNNGIGPFAFEITEIQDLGTGVATPTSEVFPTNGYNAVFNSLKGSESGIVYTIKVTSTVNSCATYVQAIVTSPAPMALAANALTATQYGCLSDGTTSLPTLTFDASLITGGSGTYVRYEFYDADTNTRLQQGLNTEYRITHPNGGRYYVTAYDSNGCEVSSPIVTVSPTLVLDDVTLSVVSGITCLQGEELMATVNTTPAYATFANAPQLTYILANADGTVEIERTSVNATTYTFVQLLQAGSYLVTVRNDDTGCEVRSTHTVLRPDTFELTATNATAVQCNGGTDGSIVLTFIDTYLADGDQALNGFDYQITNADTGAAVQNGTAPAGTTQVTITGLSAGTFHAVATSLANNCQTPLIAFSIRQSELPITVTAQETFGVTCTNDRGEILVTVSGGEAPYTVTLTPQGGTPITHTGVDFMTLFTGLGAGTGSLTYTVSVTDALGCSDVTATSITEVTLELPETVTATTVVTPISCPGAADGVIQLFGTAGGSGAGTYHYILNNITTGTSSPAQTVSYFDNLAPGEYSITITDAWNCDIELPSVTLVDPTAITFSVTTSDLVVCYGGTDTGSISFVVDGGSPQYEILLLNMTTNAQLNTATGIAPGTTVTFNNLVPGINYGITVTDTNGCTLSTTHTFALTEMPNVRATAAQSENCQTNAYQTWIEVRFPSAVDFSKITYVLNGTATATAQSFSRTEGLVGYIDTFDRTVASQYVTLFYTDTVNGQTETCDYTTPSFEVVNRSALALTRLPNDALNTIEVAASGGVSPYTYFFNGRDSGTDGVYRLRANDPQETDPVTGLKFKVIEVLAEDAAGCTVSMTIKAEYYDIEIPDYFTPDNDGNNDTWTPKYLDNYPYARTHIFDRYGRKLATLAVGETWNGRYNGNELPSGDYWFVLELNDINDKREFKGHFTLYR